VTGPTTANNKYLSSPGDFLSVFSMAVIDPSTGAYDFLLNKDVNFIREAFPTPTSTGKPEYYALFGPTTTNATPPVVTNELSFILGPTPDAIYDIELHYYYLSQSLLLLLVLLGLEITLTLCCFMLHCLRRIHT
jgi:hypothetical protein